MIRVLHDSRGNSYVVDELMFLRVTGKAIIHNLKLSLELIGMNKLREAEAFYNAAMVTFDRHDLV